MTKAVKIKADVPLVGGFELAPAEGVKAVREELARAKAADASETSRRNGPTLDVQSFYYNLFNELRRLTRGDDRPGDPRLNLVFLIDDLDRCMPEKAVEMLESIKLFLDVQGCVFVLAVDDEVVERGIAHRYRDYLDVTDRAAESIAHSLGPERYKKYLGRYAVNRQAPITGAEYLEKIVQLAIRLPRFSRKQATDLLRQHAPDLFVPSSPSPGEPASEWLLDLFLDAVPPVPRKLIRAADLLQFVQELAKRQDVLTQLHGYTLAQLTLLQVFAPQMFRYLSRGRLNSWNRLDARLKAAQLEAGSDIYGASFFDWWEKQINSARETGGSVTELDRYEEPFIAELRQACSGRSGFDPRKLFLPSLSVAPNLRPYIDLLIEESATTTTPASVATAAAPAPASSTAPPPAAPTAGPSPPAPVTAAATGAVALPAAAPRELGNFVDLLLSSHEDSWHGALDSEPGLQGRSLDRRSFIALRDAIAQRNFVVSGRWLGVVGVVLSESQVKELLVGNAALKGASSADLLTSLGAAELIEAACRKLAPWDAAVTSRFDPADIGLPPDTDITRRAWAYRYRRGLVDATVDQQETVEIWRAYPATVSSPVHALAEIKPGLLAVSHADGHVRLWSSAFRGQWMVTGHLAGPLPEGFRVAALGPVHIVGYSRSTVAVWQFQPFGTWTRIFTWSQAGQLRDLAVLSPSRFVALSESGVLCPFRKRGQWEPLPIPVLSHQISAIAPLDEGHLIAVGPSSLVLSFTDKSLAVKTGATLEGGPFSIVATTRDHTLVTFDGRQLRLVRIDGTGQEDVLSTASSTLVPAYLAQPNGDLVLLRNDVGFETWSTTGNELRRVGEGSAGEVQGGYGVALLNDGRVASATGTSGVITSRPTASGGLYDFDTHVAGTGPGTPAIALAGRGMVVTHPGGAMFVELSMQGNRLRAGIEMMERSGRGGFTEAVRIDADELLLLDARRDVVVWNIANGATQRVSLGLSAPPTRVPIATRPSAAYLAVGGSGIAHLARIEGRWTEESRVFAGITTIEGLALSSNGKDLLAWGGQNAAILLADGLTMTLPFQPPGPISSATGIPSGWRGLAHSSMLLCAGGRTYILNLDTGNCESWLPQTEHFMLAAAVGANGTVAVTSDGSLFVFDGTELQAGMPSLFHGAPIRLDAFDSDTLLVQATDDAWYRIRLTEGAPEVVRVLATVEALAMQVIAESATAPPRTAPVTNVITPIDPHLRAADVILPRRSAGDRFVPTGDTARNLAALVRKSGELAEPSARPGMISWRLSSDNDAHALSLLLNQPG